VSVHQTLALHGTCSMSWEAKYLKTRSARPKTHRISPWTMAKTEGDNGKHNGNVEKKRRAMSHIRENNGLNQFCRTHETPTELPWFPAQEMMLYEKPGWCWFYGKITYFRRVCPWFSSVDYHSEASYINWESVCWLHFKKKHAWEVFRFAQMNPGKWLETGSKLKWKNMFRFWGQTCG